MKIKIIIRRNIKKKKTIEQKKNMSEQNHGINSQTKEFFMSSSID